jgi:hypothetical protein
MYPKIQSKFWVSLLISITCYVFTVNPVLAVNNIKQIGPKDFIKTKKEDIHEIPQEKPLKHIIFIVIDGMKNGRFEGANVPNLKGVLSTGIKSNEVITQTPANLNVVLRDLLFQGHKSLLDDKEDQKVEGFIDYLKKSNKTTAFIDSNEGDIRNLVKSSDILINIPQRDDSTIIKRAIEVFDNKRPYFMGIILSDLTRSIKDVNGKNKINKTITDVDKEIGKLFYRLTELGLYDNTLFVITGTNGEMKSDNTRNDNILTWSIVKGPGIKSGISSPTFRLSDILPTVKFISNGTNQGGTEGKIIWNIIKKNSYEELYLLNKRVKDLSNEQIDHYNNLYQMYIMKKKLIVDQQRVTKEKGEIKSIINSKDNYIRRLEVKITAFKVLGVVFLVIFSIGYLIEYFILRKRFLLF